jgi:ribonuclease R
MKKNNLKKKDKRNKNKDKKQLNLVIGEFIANERGFGFVVVEGQDEDVFIPAENVNSSMNGDVVAVRILESNREGKRAEGKIVEILKRNIKVVIGTYSQIKNIGFVIVDDRRITNDIYIPKKGREKAKNNDKVVVEITKYPEPNKKAEGKIIEILGKTGDTNIDLISVLRAYNYKKKFPGEVQDEANKIPQVIDNLNGRVDLRDKVIFTIDGSDTKDIDDAVSISKKGNGYILGVHIADVSNYVKDGTLLDKEASKRGTSVYLIDTVIPMLPKELSNGICSLNPNVDRYALSVDMEIDNKGNVTNQKIYKSVIKSRIQMTYGNVYKVLEEDAKIEAYEPYVETLKTMKELALILKNKRIQRGCIDFDLPEPKIILDENDKVIDVIKREITIANKLIEEFMIIANETVAEYFFKHEIPFIYRIHEKPDDDRIQKLNIFLNNLNYKAKVKEKVNSKDLQDIVEASKGKEEEKVVSTMVLRTMKLAKYSNQNIGHFGIASEFYCHFTSPIRRYPDLFIHRVISEYLNKSLDQKKMDKYTRLSAKYSEMSSDSERVAEEAERDLDAIKKCEYISYHIGEEFEGIISSVMSFGLFVELPNTIEGLVHVENMKDDYYVFDEINVKMIGERTKKIYKIGDKVKVKVLAADKLLRRIDFQIS